MPNVVVPSQHIRSGVLRPLGMTSLGETRHRASDVKSFARQGFAGFEAHTWWMLPGRAGTPEPVERIEFIGPDVLAGGRERCRRFLIGEVDKWGRVIRENNITAES